MNAALQFVSSLKADVLRESQIWSIDLCQNVYQDSLLLLSHYQIPDNTLFWTSVPEVVTVTYQTLLSSIGPQMVRSLTKLAI